MVRAGMRPSDEISPEQLIEALLYDIRSAARVACSSYRYRASNSEIDDICQEIIILLIDDDYRRLRSFDSEKSSLKWWLKAVVTHHVSNRIRREQRAESLDDLGPESIACEPLQEKKAIFIDRQERLRWAISKLTLREQQLLEHLIKHKMSAAEAARVMGVKVDSVYRRKHALIKKLQKLIATPRDRSGPGDV